MTGLGTGFWSLHAPLHHSLDLPSSSRKRNVPTDYALLSPSHAHVELLLPHSSLAIFLQIRFSLKIHFDCPSEGFSLFWTFTPPCVILQVPFSSTLETNTEQSASGLVDVQVRHDGFPLEHETTVDLYPFSAATYDSVWNTSSFTPSLGGRGLTPQP
jgi:hypothetical protein